MDLLGLRDWEASQPRTYWGLRRPDGLPSDWYAPNAGIGGPSYSYGAATGGGGGYQSGAQFSGQNFQGSFAPQNFRSSFSQQYDPGGADITGSASNQGMNATTENLGDFVGALTTGPAAAWAGVIGQMALNGILGQPDKPITQAGILGAAYDGLFGGSNEFGATPAPSPGASGIGGRSAVGDFGGSESGMGGMPGGPENSGRGEVGDFGGSESGNFYKGGAVTLASLGGRNPPGPDDGAAFLDVGEHVFTRDNVKKLGGQRSVLNIRRALEDGSLTLAELHKAMRS